MAIDPISLIIFLAIGAAAGWLAGLIMQGGGFGLIGDVVVGIAGAFIAAWLFPFLNFSLGGGLAGVIITAAIGACVLLLVLRLLRRVF